MFPWLEKNWGNVIKGAALAAAAFGFFTSLKVDVATSQVKINQVQADVDNLRDDLASVSKKVDRLYNTFIGDSVADGAGFP